MRSLGRLVLGVVLRCLEELRGQTENPAVTGLSCERPKLAIVATGDPLGIAKPRRQVGDVGAPLWAPSQKVLRLPFPWRRRTT